MNLIKILPKDWILHRQVAIHIVKYKKLLLSYSGGLDSTVLLDILTTLRNINNNHNYLKLCPLILRVAHIHHGLHQNADMWVEHCNQQCKIRNISFKVIYIKNDYRKINKDIRNIEASARYLRYQKLYDYLNLEETILTAHHMNDQVETLFLALKRGSGPTGLSAMNIDTFYYDKYRILRPLLTCSQLQLKEYAINHHLDWIEDDTNADTTFDRNFLRIQVLPLLYKRWPSFDKVVTRTAVLCKNQENLLNELLSESLSQLVDTDGSLFFEPILQFSISKRQAILRLWISKFSINSPSYRFLHRVWQEIILSKIDATPILQLNQYLYRRFRKKLYVIPIDMLFPLNLIKLDWKNSDDTIVLPHNLGLLISQSFVFSENFSQKKLISSVEITSILNIFFNFFKKSGKILTSCIVRSPNFDEKISVQFGHVNGLLYILNRNRGRKLKKIWQELRIPPWLRSRVPLLFYNHVLIAAIGVFITKNGVIINNTKNVSQVMRKIFWVQDSSYHNFFKNSIHN